MAVEIAQAVVALTPQFQGVQAAISKELAGAAVPGGAAGKAIGGSFAGGFRTAIVPLAGIAAAGLGIAAVTGYLKDSFGAIANWQVLNAQSAAAVKATGGAANVTASQVNTLAQSLEGQTATQAETIQQGANLLLTFRNVRNEAGAGNDVFNQTTKSAVDMSRALGTDVTGSAMLLGKALNDPEAGLTKLTRSGVTFTQQQKDQVKALQDSGNMLGAQKIILAEVNAEFGGSGAAYAKTYTGQLYLLSDAFGDIGEGIVSGLLPGVTAAAHSLTGFLGSLDPASITAFGASIGNGLASAVSFVVGLINTIGPKVAGIGALVAAGFGVIGGIVAAVAPGIAAIAGSFSAGAAGAGGLGAVLGVLRGVFAALTGPIGIVVAILTTLYATNSQVRDAFNGLLGAVAGLVGQVVGALVPAFTAILAAVVPLVTSLVGSLLPVITAIVVAIVPLVTALVGQLAPIFTQLVGALLPPLVALFTSVVAAVMPLVTAVLQLIAPLAQLVGAILTPLIGLLAAVLGPIVALVGVLLGALVPVIRVVVTVLATVITAIVNVLTWIVNLVTGTGQAGAQLSAIWNGIVSFVSGAIRNMQNIIRTVLAAIAAAFTLYVNAWRTVITTVWNAIVSFVTGAINTVRSVITAGLNAVRTVVTTVFNAVRTVVSTVWSAITSLISAAIGRVQSVISSGLNTARSVVTGVFNSVRSIVSSTWNTVVSTITGAIGRVISVVSGLGPKILGTLSSIGGQLFSAGKSMIQNLINGITSMIGAAGSAIGSVVGKIASFLPHSPAQEGPMSGSGWTAVRTAGEAITQQFASGLQLDAVMRDSVGKLTAPLNSSVRVAGGIDAELAAAVAGDHTVIEYHAAPNQSLDSRQDLWQAIARKPFLTGKA